jgi:hypothetical protein
LLVPLYTRVQAYLAARISSNAEAQFREILACRGAFAFSPLYALAHPGVARADVLEGQKAKAPTCPITLLIHWPALLKGR